MRVARVDVPRNDGRQIHLFVSDDRARWAGKMCWRSCLHTVVDVANLPGVTSDEGIEKKIDSLRFNGESNQERGVRTGEEEMCRM
jgi:hypothetical protein